MLFFYRVIFFVFVIFPLLSFGQAKQNVKNFSLNKGAGFIENKGQVADQHGEVRNDVKYIYAAPGFKVIFKENNFSYEIYSYEKSETSQTENLDEFEKQFPEHLKKRAEVNVKTHRIDISLPGANLHPQIEVKGKNQFYTNHYHQYTPENGVLEVNSFKQLTYKNIWPNTDLVFYAKKDGELKYDIILHPGADISKVQFSYEGAEKISLKNNKLLLNTSLGEIEESIPYSYTITDNKKTEVKYNISGNNISFSANYDKNKGLVIDPILNWGTYFGGTSADYGNEIVYRDGFIYITGSVASTGSLATSGSHQSTKSGVYDAIIGKFTSAGTRIWATYFGGSGSDWGNAIACDSAGNVLIGGSTASSGLSTSGAHQTSNNGGEDGFLAKFTSSGTRLWCTYFGGTFADYIYDIASDNNNNIFVTGETSSTTNISTSGAHQTVNGGSDALLAKFSASGARIWGTYYGAGSGADRGYGITCDTSGNVYFTGYAIGSSGIATSGSHQASNGGTWDSYLVKFNGSGTRLWGTWYGGNSNDYGHGVACDNAGFVYLIGSTLSTNNIATSGAHLTSLPANTYCSFFAKFTTSGVRQWGTYYGGPSYTWGNGIALNNTGDVFITGFTSGTTGISTSGAHQISHGGSQDAFLARFNAAGVRQWGTYYGGNSSDYGNDVACDEGSAVYLVGYANSSSAISTPGAHQTVKNSNPDIIIAKFGGPDVALDTLLNLPLEFCLTDSFPISAVIENLYSENDTNITVSLLFSGPDSLLITDSLIKVIPGLEKDTLHFSKWIKFTKPGNYSLTAYIHSKDSNGFNDSLKSNIIVYGPAQTGFTFTNNCLGAPIFFQDTSIAGSVNLTYQWYFGDGDTSTLKDPVKTYSNPGTYNVKLVTAINNSCKDSVTIPVIIDAPPVANITTSDTTVCLGANFNLNTSAGAGTFYWSPGNLLDDSLSQSPIGTIQTKTIFYLTVTKNGACSATDSVLVSVDTSTVNCSNLQSAGGVINQYAKVFAIDTCFNAFTLDSASYFSVGDKALLIQMKGAEITTSNTSAFGSITDYKSTGKYEFIIVDSVSGDKVFSKKELLNNYDVSAGLQLVKVPVYKDLLVKSNITAQAWDGSKGGIVVFEADNIYLFADIDVSGKGFRGGTLNQGSITCHSPNYFYNNTSTIAANKGEGIVITQNAYMRGKGAQANGGGGGNDHNAAGGGGANYGAGGNGGNEWDNCGGTTLVNGGVGGKSLATGYNEGRLFFGGGGGAGHANNSNGSPGTNGGGLVFITGNNFYGNNKFIKSNGLDQNVISTNDGSGGAGAGGTVIINTNNIVSSAKIEVTGGKGGNNNFTQCIGTGGGGGGGIILFKSNTVQPGSTLVMPGLPGSQLNNFNPCYNTNFGESAGSTGITWLSKTFTDTGSVPFNYPAGKIDSFFTAVCPGDSIQLSATGGVSYIWLPGKMLNDSTISNPKALINSNTNFVVKISNAKGCFVTDTVTVTTLPSPQLKHSVLSCASITNDSTVDISWKQFFGADTPFFAYYKICRSTDNFSTYTIDSSITNWKITSYTDTKAIGADTQVYEYVIHSVNTCGKETPFGGAGSAATIVIKAERLSDISVKLSWNKPSFNHFYKDTFYLEADYGSGFLAFRKYNVYDFTNTLEMQDIIADCNSNARYRIRVQDTATTCFFLSNTTNIIPLIDSISPAIPEITSFTWLNNLRQIRLKIDTTIDGYSKRNMILSRSANGQAFQVIDSVSLSANTTFYDFYYVDNQVQFTEADTNYYCYRAQAYDTCGNLSAIEEVCPPHIDALAANNKVILKISPITINTTTSYLVFRKTGNGTFSFYTTINPDSVFEDTAVTCGTKYSYYLGASHGNAISYTGISSATPFDTISPTPPQLKLANVVSNNVNQLTFIQSTDKNTDKYFVYGAKNGGGFVLLDSLGDNNLDTFYWQHLGVNTLKDRWCYYLTAKKECGNTISVPSDTHCVMQLTGVAGNTSSLLQWADYKGFTIDKYIVERLNASNLWEAIDSVSNNILNYADENLHCGKWYQYRIKARPNGGNNYVSYSDTIAIKPFDTIAPAKVNMLNVSALDNASAEINFNAVADADVVKYELFVSENGGSYNLISTFIKPFLAPLQYAHNNIDLINNTYCYRVLASDSCGNISQTSETHCVVKLQAVAGNNSATLRWSRYKGFDAINTYIVQRKNALVWDDIATISDTNFTDQPLTCNLSQEYRIFTIEGGGDNKQSFSNSLIVTPFDTAKPLSPAIKYVTVKDGFPNMAWQKSASIDVRNYIIYRKKGSGNWDSIAYVNDIDTFTDISADASLSAYCYKIQAQDSCAKNKSPLSGEHCTMLLSSSVSGCEKAINLNWLPYKGWNNISKIEIYRAVDGGAEVLLETLPANAINFKDSLLDYHLEYCYRVAAYELGVNNSVSWSNVSCNNTFFVDTAHIYTVSKMLTSATNGSIKIKWKSQAGKPHFSHYKLYYSQSGLGAFNLLDGNIPIAKDSFIHSNINTRKGAHYYYLINTDSCGTDSDPSSTHKAIDLEVEIGQLIHDLSWTKYEGFDVQEYRIQRFSGTEFVDIDTLVATDTFLRQFPAPCNYHIIYRVGAVDADGRIAYSDTMGRVAIDTVFANGASLQNVSINSGSQSEINFRGSDSLDVYAYTIQRSKDGNWGTAGQVIFTSPGDTHTFNDAVNTTSEQLCYTIITLDSCLNATMSADTFCAIQLKGQELNLANTIAWHGFKGYDIDKYSVLIHNGLNWDTLSTTTSDTNYLHQPLSCNVPVTYKIAGTENGGRITLSDSITLIPYDTIKPAQPTMHFTSVLKDGKIYISWPQSADSDVKLYEISIRSQNGNWNIEDTLENTFEYTFSGLNTMDSLYNFSIKAIDSCAENTSVSSDYHAPVQLKGAPKNLSNLLEWASYEGFGGIEKHIIYIYENGWQKLDSTLSNTTNYTHTPLNCNVPRIYKVLTVSQNADYESWSDSIVLIPFDTIKPAQPTMHYTSVLEDGKIYVSWPQSADNDVKLYEISFRSQNGNWKIEDTLENTFEYTFSGLNTMDSLYNFSIKAIDSCAENTSVASDYHAPVQLKGAPKNLSNLLEWAAYEGFAGIEKHIIYIYENGWKKLDSTLSNTTTYTHTPLNCNVPRIYKVLTVSQNADYESWSDSIVLIPFDTIKPAQPGINYTTVNDGESIFISWQASDLDVKKYELSYRTENGDWQIRDTVQDALEYVFTGLEPVDSTYNFRISAIDSCAENTSIYSEFHSPVQLRGEPKNLSNYLHWSAYKGFDVKQYYIYNYNNGWNKIDSTPASTLEYTHLPLACNVPQYYKVYALDVKNAFVSVSDSIQLIPFDTLKPAAPVMHAVSVEDDRSIKLSWSYDTASDVKYFEVWRNSNGGSYSLQSTVIYDSTFTDVNVSAQSNIYSYYVIAIDSCNLINRSGASDTDRIVTLQLASGACLPEIRLSWTHYVDFEHGVDGYDIFRKTALETNYTKINTVKSSDSTYKDATVLLGNTYFYKIRAFDIESSYESYSDSSGLEPYQYPVPDAPNMLYATVQQTGTVFGSIYVEWEKYFIPGDTFARGYKLYHSLNNGTYNLVHTQHGLDKTDFLHKNINTSAGLHKYYVRVFNLCDIEGDTSRNFRPANLEVYNRNLAAYVSWHPFKGENVIKYELYRARNQASPMLLQTFSSSDTSYADTNIFCGNNYTYSLRVYLGNGRISYADTVSIIAFDTIPPAVPQLYYVSVDTTLSAAGKISMMWKGNSEKNRAGYRIYRSVNGGSMQLHVIYLNKNIGDIFWEDVNLNTKDNYYSYAISSIDSCQENESEMSETHRSIYLKTQAMSQYMQLNWHIYTGWENWLYVVEKQESGKPWRTIDTLAANQVSYHDSDVICHSFYNYRIRGIEDTTVWISFSNTAGDTAFETALPAAPLIASASVTNTGISDGKILLSWQKSEAKDAATYNILRSEDGNNWLPVISNHTDLFFEDFGINTSERSYYYTINTVDSCGNISDTFSSPHKTILLNASAGNSQNNLVWSAYQGWKVKEYAIYKDGVKSFSVPGDVTSFKDTQVFCTKMYNYHIEAIADSNIVLSALSNIDSAKSYDTRAPRKIYLNTVTVSKANTEVTLTWDESDNFDTRIYYIYKRSGADNSLALLDSTTALTYTETQDSIRYSDCYFVHAVDYCNNISAASNPGCIMILTGKNFTDFHNLSWNEYREWKDGVKNYRIFKKEDNQNWSEIGFTDKTSFTDNFINDTISNHCYQVEASENIGSHNALSLSTTLCLHQDPIVYIPNAFTPGITSEGINDVFGPKGLNIRNYKMQIYNRWGQLVYDTQSGKPWDGSINGDAAMEGVYLYIITIDSYNPNASKRVKGTVTILK